MTDFIDIISDKRRTKAQLKKLSESELLAVQEKFNSAVSDVAELFEEQRAAEAEKKQKADEILQQMKDAGISIEELAGNASTSKVSNRKKLPPKYKFINEDGEAKTWTGQGRMPSVLKQAVDSGKPLENYLIRD